MILRINLEFGKIALDIDPGLKKALRKSIGRYNEAKFNSAVENLEKMIKEHPLELRRIFTITAHIDHGKSTACDYLMGRAGLISKESEGQRRLTDGDEEEIKRGITIFSSVAFTSSSRYFLTS
jgi:hypothetical protein